MTDREVEAVAIAIAHSDGRPTEKVKSWPFNWDSDMREAYIDAARAAIAVLDRVREGPAHDAHPVGPARPAQAIRVRTEAGPFAGLPDPGTGILAVGHDVPAAPVAEVPGEAVEALAKHLHDEDLGEGPWPCDNGECNFRWRGLARRYLAAAPLLRRAVLEEVLAAIDKAECCDCNHAECFHDDERAHILATVRILVGTPPKGGGR
jgi:hypothetical protein